MERRFLLVLVVIYLVQIFAVESSDPHLKSCMKKLQEKYLNTTNGQPPSCINKETLKMIICKTKSVQNLGNKLSSDCNKLNQQNISKCLLEVVDVIADNEDTFPEIMFELLKLELLGYDGCLEEVLKVVHDYMTHIGNGCADL